MERLLQVLMITVAALSTASSALGQSELHFIFKPLTIAIAIIFVAARAINMGARARFNHLLIAALLASLAGDVFLMLPGNFFIPGLASFLLAHLFYIALFSLGFPWLPSRVALLCTLGIGAAMYGWVWGGLTGPALKLAVGIYITVIALMAAQAIGRAKLQADMASKMVAMGACIFMLSDALIAIDRFVAPIPRASLWVLSSYYLAQVLITFFAKAPARSQHGGQS